MQDVNWKNRLGPRMARLAMLASAFCLPLIQPLVATADDAAPEATTQPAAAAPLISKGLDEKTGNIVLFAGQSRLVVARVPMRTVDVTQPDVVLAKVVTPTDILVTARKPGTSQLLVWDDQGHSQAIEITVNADMAGLQGEFKKVFPALHIESSIAGGAIVLRGPVSSSVLAEQVMQVAAPYAPKVINLMEISGGQQVTLHVRFAEVSRSATTNLGFNAFANGGNSKFGWNNGPGVNPIGGLNSLTASSTIDPTVAVLGAGKAGAFAFEFFIQALRENNLLRVLAEPNLTVISGSEASFLAGGEFPYPVPQSSGAGGGGTAITIVFKQYGVRLSFTPVVLGDGRVRLRVHPEVSDLDFTHSLQLNGFVIPAITTRMTDTTVELNEGQTLALAGLLNNRVNTINNVTPLLGDLPVVGALFRSVRYQRDQTELVVLVTPQLAEGMNPEQVRPVPGEHWRYPTESELFWRADLGGPMPDAAHAPSTNPPPRFHGSYGFVPARSNEK